MSKNGKSLEICLRINRIIMEFKFVDGDLRTFRAEAELIES